MNEAQLEPCPFCGSDHLIEWKDGDCILCRNCDTAGPSLTEDCVAAWNRRADLPATRAQIMASPEVRALVEAAKNAVVAMQEAKGVIVAKREWALVDGAVKDLRAALAAFKAMEAGG